MTNTEIQSAAIERQARILVELINKPATITDHSTTTHFTFTSEAANALRALEEMIKNPIVALTVGQHQMDSTDIGKAVKARYEAEARALAAEEKCSKLFDSIQKRYLKALADWRDRLYPNHQAMKALDHVEAEVKAWVEDKPISTR